MLTAQTHITIEGKSYANYIRKTAQSIIFWWNNQCYRFRGGRAFAYLNLKILFGSFLFFMLNQFVLKSFTNNFAVHSYFNDALAIGILVPYANLMLGLYPGRDIRMLRPLTIFVFAICAGIFWEYVTPLYFARSVSDPWDLIAYGAGAVAVILLIGRPKASSSKNYSFTGK